MSVCGLLNDTTDQADGGDEADSPGAIDLGSNSGHYALSLPPEIVLAICDLVDNATIKRLRRTCRYFSQTARLRLHRVFLSANPLNVKVFCAIASHEVFRKQITEIIWDDTLLYNGPGGRPTDLSVYQAHVADVDAVIDCDEDGSGVLGEDIVPDWYQRQCEERDIVPDWERAYRHQCEIISRNRRPLKKPEAQEDVILTPARQPGPQVRLKAWAYYQDLLYQESEMLRSRAHICALENHISSFPALQRITIIPENPGRLFLPSYWTPMVRALPRDFSHPILPCVWPDREPRWDDCPGWESDGSDCQGVRTSMRLLAQNRDGGTVTELRVEAKGRDTGMNSRIFEHDNDTLRNFEAAIARPNFKRLHLELMVDRSSRQANILRGGLLKRALAGAAGGKGLEHLSFGTNAEAHLDCNVNDWYVPLETIFTPAKFSQLQYFSLSGFCITQDDVFSLLAAMPPSLRKVELNYVGFMWKRGNISALLRKIRDTLGWQARSTRPKLSIRVRIRDELVLFGDGLDEYLYAGGDHPFGHHLQEILLGILYAQMQ